MAAPSTARAWREAAGGLDAHCIGIVLRLSVVAAFVACVFGDVAAREIQLGGGPNAIAMLLAIAETVAVVIALVGAVRFARALPVRARSMVRLAPVCFGVVAIANGYAAWIVWKLVHAHAAPTGQLLGQADQLPTIQIIAAIAGMLALLATLGGVATAAGALGDFALAIRARNVQALLLVLPISIFVILKFISASTTGGVAIVGLVVLAGFALFVAICYLRVLRAASALMRASSRAADE